MRRAGPPHASERCPGIDRGDYAQAEADAARQQIGRRFGDADLFALGVHFQGRALLKLGRVREGLALLDESMISVLTGEVWQPVAGNIYCSMIDACRDLRSAARTNGRPRWRRGGRNSRT